MSKKRKINWTLITILFLYIFVILFIKLYQQNKYLKTKNGIEENGTFGIAKVLFYKPYTFWATGDGAASDIRISFNYNNNYFEGVPIDPKVEAVKINSNYIVVFDSTNLKRCIILYDYPVSDSTQFLKDLEYLKKHPPKPYYESLIWGCFKNKKKLW